MERKKRADQKKYHIIYKTTCLITSKFYIGMHSSDCLEDGYLGSGYILKRSVKKHGEKNHVRETLEYCPDRKTLRARERAVVDLFLGIDPLCINIAKGGCEPINRNTKRRPMSEATKKKISQANKGRRFTDEHRKKLSRARKGASPWNKGRSWTEEEKKKISDSLKGRPCPTKGMKGSPLTDEHKAKLSCALKGKNKGKKMSEEQKEKLRQANRGKVIPDDVRQKISQANKGQVCVYNPITKERKKVFPDSIPDGFIRGRGPGWGKED